MYKQIAWVLFSTSKYSVTILKYHVSIHVFFSSSGRAIFLEGRKVTQQEPILSKTRGAQHNKKRARWNDLVWDPFHRDISRVFCVTPSALSRKNRVAGVESSTSPVGMEVDSRVRMLAWGCCWGNPGGSPLSPPPRSGRGGAH